MKHLQRSWQVCFLGAFTPDSISSERQCFMLLSKTLFLTYTGEVTKKKNFFFFSAVNFIGEIRLAIVLFRHQQNKPNVHWLWRRWSNPWRVKSVVIIMIMMPLCNISAEDEDEQSAQSVGSYSPQLIWSTTQFWSIPLREKTERNKKCSVYNLFWQVWTYLNYILNNCSDYRKVLKIENLYSFKYFLVQGGIVLV